MEISQVQLQQSHVVYEEPARMCSMRVPQFKPAVKFEYSRVTKEQEMRESLALDQ